MPGQRLIMRCSAGVAEAAYCMEQVMEYGADVMMLFFLLNVYDGQRYSEEQAGRINGALQVMKTRPALFKAAQTSCSGNNNISFFN